LNVNVLSLNSSACPKTMLISMSPVSRHSTA
jgi:hypothetical protein